MEIGCTFSHRFVEGMGLDVMTSLETAIDMGMEWVRLACYWSEITETGNRGKQALSFEKMHAMLKICEERKVKMVMVLGSKAPRWPEFYVPEWAASLNNDGYEKSLLVSKRLWVAELQGEPWEKNFDAYRTESPKSMSFGLLQKNFEKVKKLNPEVVL